MCEERQEPRTESLRTPPGLGGGGGAGKRAERGGTGVQNGVGVGVLLSGSGGRLKEKVPAPELSTLNTF